jgi:hypothetical protein
MMGNHVAPALELDAGLPSPLRSGGVSSSSSPSSPLFVALQSTGVEAEGGSALVVGLVLVTFVVAAVFSAAIAYRLYVGYRGSGDRSMLAIAVGLLLLTTVPTAIRIVVPTALGGYDALRVLAATSSELLGLLAILYAVRRPSRTRRRVERPRATLLPILAIPLAAVPVAVAVDDVVVLALAVTPIVGTYVSWLAYRGYRRNDSRPMAFLALGIFLLTVLPAIASLGVGPLLGATDAKALLAASLSQLGGLVSIHYSLTRA